MRTLKSVLMGAAALGVLIPTTANAQDVDDEIVVTGIRGSLKNSIDIKRNADSVVDSISAEDVGKFPDTNLAESLQRITGVAIDRSGGEGQFVTVRGLGPEFVGVFINGRTIATDNPGREFSFDVLSSNITSRLDVLKTPTPDRQSGGIGGQVNIITARPLDTGTKFSVSAAG
ncbi:MAG: TonB-dependent receptor plug domain-containing protein, partial [Pseudomonadota bacterium]